MSKGDTAQPKCLVHTVTWNPRGMAISSFLISVFLLIKQAKVEQY